MLRSIIVISVIIALAGCCSRPNEDASTVLAEAAETEFGDSLYGCADTIAVAESAGVDYCAVVERCLARDREAMGILFSLSKDAHLDAASSQGHAAVLGSLLRKLGDRFFSECLGAQSS